MAKDDRTEKPTPKRLREARRKGQVARSAELPTGLGLALAIAVLPTVIPRLGSVLTTDWTMALSSSNTDDPRFAIGVFGTSLQHAMVAVAPAIAVVGLGGILAAWIMAGARPNPHQLKPKFDRLDPKKGLKRIFSKQVLWELGRNVVKLTLLGLVAWSGYQIGIRRLLADAGTFDSALTIIATTTKGILNRLALLAVLIGVADAIYAKRKHLDGLKMTKHEVKDEHKQAEGNQFVKAELRRRQLTMSRSRMMAEVSRASVVITNPTHFAVALAYEDGSPAPVVVAKGADAVARRIRDEARKWGVPVRENKPLARSLFRSCELGDEIPVELYQAVAELLAAIMRAKRRVVA